MGRRKEIALAMRGLRQNLHISGLYQDRGREASREKLTISRSTRFGIPL